MDVKRMVWEGFEEKARLEGEDPGSEGEGNNSMSMSRDQAEKLWDNAFGYHLTNGEGSDAMNNPLFLRAASLFLPGDNHHLACNGNRALAVAFLKEWARALESK